MRMTQNIIVFHSLGIEIILFLKKYRNFFCQLTKNYSAFTQKIGTKHGEIRVKDPGFGKT